ncbi:hypothetical protein [Pseudonocardia xinjiangensis]|uniref:Adenylylsulfate kinase-like enzyme n=1 Tax=Pseudonocardia xinjiangensis TaxID=75289 RepID=A0ABX1RC70_9PSEU|nr:hypothetical protein [Pseudonocardia xinjiangensis]NMH77617.1 hypothetical protein [Pseudonocardia xinjiangensis]
MSTHQMQVLWVSGAPGTGKSTVGWGLFKEIAARGADVAYLDMDQLGLIGPPPGGGDASHRIKIENLLVQLSVLRSAGARRIIVSGVIDPDVGIEPYLAGHPLGNIADFRLVRLVCERDELRRRFLGRGSPAGLLEQLMILAEQLDRTDFGASFDTTGQRPDETVDELLNQFDVETDEAPVQEMKQSDMEPASGGSVLVVTGATATGKSTACWQVLHDLWKEGVSAAFVDIGQLRFSHPNPPVEVTAARTAALWNSYKRAGAQVLIAVDRDASVAAKLITSDPVVFVELVADSAALADRVARRAAGESPLLAGDEIRGIDGERQAEILQSAVGEAERLRSAGRVVGTIVIETSDQLPAQTADAIRDVAALHIPELSRS